MRRTLSLLSTVLMTALSVFAQGGIGEPVLGHYRDADGRMIRILGAPGALRVMEVSDDPDAREGLAEGWRLTTTPDGARSLVRDETGESFLVPMADAILRVYQVGADGSEQVVGDRVDFPATPPNETRTVRFRVKNEGTAVLTVNKLVLSGTGFKITDAFLIPRTFAVNTWADFWVQFAPTTTGTLQAVVQINTRAIQLVGSSEAQPILQQQSGSTWVAVPSTTPYDFGKVPSQSSVERKFRIWLPDGVSAPTEPPSIEGTAFRLTAGGEGFSVFFEPPTPATYSAKLHIGSAIYAMTGTGTEVAPPKPLLSPSVSTLESGKQQTVSISFSEAAKANTQGTLQVDFQPESDALGQDASIAFLPGLGRTVTFTVKAGATAAEFNGASSVQMQTGSTAGWITLTANLGSYHETMKYHVAPAPVVFTGSRASRSTNLLEVTVQGVDNLRTATAVGFTFYLTSGGVIGSGAMTADVTQAFKTYYSQNAQAGGVFLLNAHFPVSGDVSLVGSVTVTLTNSAGTRELTQISFQ